MTNSQLELLISQLNNNQNKENIILRPLSDQVDFAKVWIEIKKPIRNKSFIDGPLNFYFIKNDEELYISAVRDMVNDLHWFTLPTHRGQGHLSKALAEIILFHLFQDRTEQRITIDEDIIGIENYKASKKVASKLGFKSIDKGLDSILLLSSKKYKTNQLIIGKNAGFDKDRMEELVERVNLMSLTLGRMQIELEMKLGCSDYTEELNELVGQVKDQTWKLEDAWHEWKNQEWAQID